MTYSQERFTIQSIQQPCQSNAKHYALKSDSSDIISMKRLYAKLSAPEMNELYDGLTTCEDSVLDIPYNFFYQNSVACCCQIALKPQADIHSFVCLSACSRLARKRNSLDKQYVLQADAVLQ